MSDSRIPGKSSDYQLSPGEKRTLLCWLIFVIINAYIVVFHPESYWKCYTISIIIAYGFRGYDYTFVPHKGKVDTEYWTYFLFDFCYVVGLLSLVNIYFFNYSTGFNNAMYILGNCPLLFAIFIWRNSFVLYDMDKMLSCCIHILPSLLYYTSKWSNVNIFIYRDIHFLDFVYASGIYFMWQVLYYIKTEIIDADFLNSHPEYLTSLRWISVDEKNSMRAICLNVCRTLKLFDKNEVFDPVSAKTKVAFMFFQFLYTFLMMIPGYFLHRFKVINEIFIVLTLGKALHNGYKYHMYRLSKS
jgi:hypothetical protein